MADFDWNDLRAFLAVARSGRLTAAAARLGVDHSTLSRRIGALEHKLKAKLFDRSPSGYSATEAGRRLMPLAEEMERLALGAAETVGGSAGLVEGVVRIGSPEGFGSYFLAPRIQKLKAQHPQLVVQLVAASAVFSLAKREADIAISVSRPPTGRLMVSKLIDYDLGLYAAPAYLAGVAPIGSFGDLKGHRFVSYIGDLLHFPELDFLQQVVPGGITSMESSNLVAQTRATLAGAGLCVLPAFLAREEPGLVRVLADEVNLTRSLWLTVHQDLAELARVRAAVRFIKDEVEAARGLFKLVSSPCGTHGEGDQAKPGGGVDVAGFCHLPLHHPSGGPPPHLRWGGLSTVLSPPLRRGLSSKPLSTALVESEAAATGESIAPEEKVKMRTATICPALAAALDGHR